MDTVMDHEEMRALAKELAKGLKTEQDLTEFTTQLTKMAVDAALGAEMEHHLGYGKHEASGRNTGNSRNGMSSKRLKGSHGVVDLEVPRDRNGTFEPALVNVIPPFLIGIFPRD
jgi:putative transposase